MPVLNRIDQILYVVPTALNSIDAQVDEQVIDAGPADVAIFRSGPLAYVRFLRCAPESGLTAIGPVCDVPVHIKKRQLLASPPELLNVRNVSASSPTGHELLASTAD